MTSDDIAGGRERRPMLPGWRVILIALSAATGAYMALAFATLVPPRYTATTRIADPVGPRVDRDLCVLTSPAVLSRVVRAARLDGDGAFTAEPSPTARLGAEVKAVLRGWKPPVLAPDDVAASALARAVTAARDRDAGVIAVSVTAPEAGQAARLADIVAATFLSGFQPDPATARVLSPAPLSGRRIWPPRRGALLVAGLLLGVVAGALATATLDRLTGRSVSQV